MGTLIEAEVSSPSRSSTIAQNENDKNKNVARIIRVRRIFFLAVEIRDLTRIGSSSRERHGSDTQLYFYHGSFDESVANLEI